ncbi:MAG: hypothetical protein AVDCRST_MAG38-123 [uncultured Solirubrobacteraceae bacterium]|uniref:DUF1707 domain-containing protein n=1 Tax=uncultured Solirubrobacteraceae bacterium TaxID=1162706 RepID=A0A6J4R6H5_9ACTN|nr:MAG: hypothetical protein AVDCRST_MAG38-123 [uncultured Solirubrobacteraceae bacterium]
MSEPPVPALRASDADRERVAEVLRRAAADGQISFDELDDRLDQAYAARTRDELGPITADLQVPDDAAAPDTSRSFTVRPGGGGAQWLVAIMGGCERKGRWRLGRRAVSLNIMGGSDLDLNQVELADESVELTVVSIMGGSDIRVPHGLNVEVSEFALMGANGIDIADDRPAAGKPVLHLRLYSIMGGADVKRGPKLSRAERKALKQRRADHLGH